MNMLDNNAHIKCMYKLWLLEWFQSLLCKAMKKLAVHKCLIVNSHCWVSMKSKCCCKSCCKQPTLFFDPSCFWILFTKLMLSMLHQKCAWRRAGDALSQLEYAASYTSTRRFTSCCTNPVISFDMENLNGVWVGNLCGLSCKSVN